jgi:hypothetical protein
VRKKRANMLDSGTWRRTATRLRVGSARFRDVKPSDHTKRVKQGGEQGKRVADAELGGDGRAAAHN